MNELSIILKKIRERHNITIAKLSELSGLAQGTIGDIETGRRKGSIKTLEKISKALALNEEERAELFAGYVPKDLGVKLLKNPLYLKLDKRGRMQLNDIIEQSTLMFNDEQISDNDKEKVLMAIQSAFFDAKQKNKRK